MNLVSRTITGGVMIIVGVALLAMSIFISSGFLIYALPILIIGLIIFFNKKEDKIEQIKKVKGREK